MENEWINSREEAGVVTIPCDIMETEALCRLPCFWMLGDSAQVPLRPEAGELTFSPM